MQFPALPLPSRRRRTCRRRRLALLELLEGRQLLAVFQVVNLGDAGAGSLRAAISSANALAGADQIQFSPAVTGTITLDPTLGEIEITDPVSIEGPGAGQLTVEANTATIEHRIFNVTAEAADVSIEGLTLTGGRTLSEAGGAIRFQSDGTLTIRSSVLTGNTAANGGAVYSEYDGNVTLTDSTVSGNTALYGAGGGVQTIDGDITLTASRVSNNEAFNSGGGLISQYSGGITVRDSELLDNRVTYPGYNGGAINSGEGAVTISGSRVSGNTAAGDGGGIYNYSGLLSISSSTISGNSAGYSGGGILNETGDIVVTDSIVEGNTAGEFDGGGIANDAGNVALTHTVIRNNRAVFSGGGISTSSGRIVSLSSTLSGNTAGTGGGGIATLSGLVSLTGSTVSTNVANDGAGIQSASGAVRLANSTVTLNTASGMGGGLHINAPADGETLTLSNSIVAQNTAATNPDFTAPDNPAANLTVTNSLIGDNEGTTLPASPLAGGLPQPDGQGNLIGGGTAPVIDAQLAPLAIAGGALEVHQPLPGSPVIDAGNNSLAVDPGPDGLPGGGDDENLAFDQRNYPYVRIADGGGGANVDIGSVEIQPTPPLIVDTTDDIVNGNFQNGDISLREAIQLANSSPEPNVIQFAGVQGTITLDPALGPLVIDADVTIVGPGADQLTISPDASAAFRIFDISSAASQVEITGFTLAGGSTDDSGGAIRFRSSGTLTVGQSEIRDNLAAESGAGIFNDGGTLTVFASTIANNHSVLHGGGIAALAGSLELISTTVSANSADGSGGGLYSANATVDVRNSTITLNDSGVAGGGIGLVADDGGETLTIQNSIVAANTGVANPDFTAPGDAANNLVVQSSLVGINSGTTLAQSERTGSPQPDAEGNLVGGPGILAINPQLGPLAANGGATRTHFLLDASDAIDAGDSQLLPPDTFDLDGDLDVAESLPVDQRGATRIAGSQLDMGAVEIPPEATITWPMPSDIVFGTELSATQLNAMANTAGAFAYTPDLATVLSAGAGQTLSVTFTPDDALSFRAATATQTINVLKANPAVNWSDPAAISFGTALSATQLNATSNIAGQFAYSPDLGTVLEGGTGQQLMVTFTPDDADNYNIANASVMIDVNPVDPLLTWNPPADIVFGTPLGGTQLNATASFGGQSVAGTFVYSPDDGTILNVGADQQLDVTFTPNNLDSFNEVTASVLITVTAADDFGDAPSRYPVTFAEDGARHSVGSLRLGSEVDVDPDGQESEAADGDGSDDDGVSPIATLPVAANDSTSSLLVVASEAALLDAWIDFDDDGIWEPAEQIAASLQVQSGPNILSFTVPAGTPGGDFTTSARFRLSSAGNLDPTGAATDGEVEDYLLSLVDANAAAAMSVDLPAPDALIRGDQGRISVEQGGGDLLAADVAAIDTLTVNGSDEDDTLTVNIVGTSDLPGSGNPIVVSGAAGDNRLTLQGTLVYDLSVTGNVEAHRFNTVDLSEPVANHLRIGGDAVERLAPTTRTIRVIADEDDIIDFIDPEDWRMTDPRIIEGRFVPVARHEVDNVFVRLDRPNPWQNPIRPSDVNNDGRVTALDALVGVNELAARDYSAISGSTLNDPLTVSPWPHLYYDQNGDGRATALDSLRVINEMARLRGAGEGESLQLAAAIENHPSEVHSEAPSSDLDLRLNPPNESVGVAEIARVQRAAPGVESVAVSPQDAEALTAFDANVDELLSDERFVEGLHCLAK